MNRYEITIEIQNRIKLFGIVIKKGTKHYNIKDNDIENCMIYSSYNKYTKKSVEAYCNYLNKYHTAKKYIIVKDGNDIYWIFSKTNNENLGIKNEYGIRYIKLGNSGYLQFLNNLKTGCKTIKDAKETLKNVYINYKQDKNSKSYKIISE